MTELWKELRSTYYNANCHVDMAWERVAERARALLAKPVATGEAVKAWAYTQCWPMGTGSVDIALAALSHFAPPASNAPISKMSVEEIAREVQDTLDNRIPSNSQLTIAEHIAYAIHRLAQPAPVVDSDAEAKRLHDVWSVAFGVEHTPWENLNESMRNGWRAVAKEKANG